MAVVKINAIHVPEESGPELEKRFAAHGDSMLATPGFLGYELLRPIEGEHRYFVYTRWESDEAFEAWRTGGAAEAAHSGQRAQPVATGADLLQFEVALSVGKGGGES
ncbi:MAG: Heme-degrading protein MhuD (no EC) [uncultured Actinomycetospora sp.]|jgi:heme oxygenase (mycobilin-producing)|uniref:Heme-degrading protein MhuD (No EC) n=1 Tax=uncultured Actinomycetospora sp. TaxID=1135996 RepID=A0A6J4ITB5_9PSEU|nr:MAG: Heme-degrading protein MhuD (no EC) [uncultured Actinomycetospora sp.]